MLFDISLPGCRKKLREIIAVVKCCRHKMNVVSSTETVPVSVTYLLQHCESVFATLSLIDLAKGLDVLS